MFKMDDEAMGHGSAKSVMPAQPAMTLSLGMFSPAEIAKLVSARDRFLSGAMHEWTEDHKRLQFAKWLYEHRRISG
jgi:hypothetical protein